MKNSKQIKIVSMVTIVLLVICMFNLKISNAADITSDYKVNLSDLTYTTNDTTIENLKKYTQDDFQTFLSDYNSGELPEIYVTEFLFDGVGMVKTYDLDDFIEGGNDAEVKTLKITAINVNTNKTVEFTGDIKGGMIAVDTNGRTGEMNLLLSNAKIDTDSKKAPAIFVYNKDITYTGCKVTIRTATGSKNYLEGGKLKKVSLVASDELSNYTGKYSGDAKTNYSTYTNYYGVYTSAQLNNILFAKVQADSEDLADGDPYYFYKAAGAVSSDIDLHFEGTGYLEVKSKNKEGIETKGNLTFSGGTGDYAIYSEDDCLNTTTKSSANTSARNALTIDVNSLYAIVDSGEDADEGDAIDSNGTLVINGGIIVAIAHPGQDAGLDSENGTYINGGAVIATGDMLDPISNESKQNYMTLSFANKVSADTLITLLNDNNEVMMSYKTDRTYTNLVYSSPKLINGTYLLYKGGEIDGEVKNGYYTSVSNYTKGTRQAYSSIGAQGGMMGQPGNGQMPSGERPELPKGEASSGERPELPNGEIPSNMPENTNNENTNTTANAENKEFVVNGIANQFSGIEDYSGTDDTQTVETAKVDNQNNNNNTLKDILSNKVALACIGGGIGLLVIAVIVLVVFKKKKKE